ncbi:PIN domain-containing protein [Cephaloticoccus primus]|nr:PIN domain-containing protein [Cephaloticoccus primus]
MIAEAKGRRLGIWHAVMDACVLANHAVANLLLTLAEAGVIFPLWSEQILGETYRTHTLRLSWEPHFAHGFRAALLHNFPDSSVSGYEQWIGRCTNHEKDRHVLACAIEGRASVIVTYNLRDFGEAHLGPWRIRALHPQDFLLELYGLFPEQLGKALNKIARNNSHKLGREITVEEELAVLSAFVPKFAETLLTALKNEEPRS